MAARGGGRSRPTDPTPSQFGVYCCSHCGRPLQLEMVVSADAERVDGTATGYIVFQHFCACERGCVRVSRGWGSHPLLLALFGSQPALPYHAPFDWQGVRDDDPVVSRWRWELGQVVDWADFMLFLDDAADRRAA